MSIDRRHVSAVATHIIFIVLLCVLPEVLMGISSPHRHFDSWGVYAKSAVMLVVFYANYFYLIPRMLTRRRDWWSFVGLNLVLIVACVLLMYFIAKWGWAPGGKRLRHQPDEWHLMLASASFMIRDGVMLILVTSLAVALRLSASWRDLNARRHESELLGLRSQLNPHFLFNTLNSIYALIAISPPEAQRAVHELSAMLRYMVYENPERVPLSREVDFVGHYISLMRLRLGRRPVTFETDIDCPDTPVMPLLFVTLVENAFKYGAAAPPARPVEIRISCRDGRLVCSTCNSFVPREKEGASGVGLANLRRRLEIVYGDAASLTTSKEGDTFQAILSINLK